MDSFEGIIEFVAVAESNGFSAAAKHLGVSTSHASRQVSRLEARLGCVLLARTTRRLSLTNEGLAYYRQCQDLVTGLQVANEQIHSKQLQLSGTLRVSAAGTFAEQSVAPALMAFAEQYPELNIEMDFDSRRVNFIEEGVDFAIRYGQLQDSGLVARKLIDRPMMAAASQQYLQKYGVPENPNELVRHSCIISNNDHWQFNKGNESYKVKVSGRWRSNNAQAVFNACEQGLGIAYMPKSSFIQSNKLEPVLEPYWGSGSSSWIVYQNRRFLPLRARLAIDYLLKYFADWKE